MPYCPRRACIGSSLNNFAQRTPWLPRCPASLEDFWASSFFLSIFIFHSSIHALLDARWEGISSLWLPRMILQKQQNLYLYSAFLK